MKRLETYAVLLTALLLLVAVPRVQAQNQKVGYVNTDYILERMPGYQNIQQELETLSSQWNSRLEEMQSEINQLKEDFEAKEILYTDELKAQKQQEIQSKVNQREQYLEGKFGSGGEYFQKQKELLEPLQRKVFNAINAVASQQNFDFVFDRAQNSSMLVGSQQWNLNQDVLQELGITLNESSN